MNLREQFNADTKGHEHFNAYCRALVDKKPTTLTFKNAHKCLDARAMFDKYPMGCKSFGAEWLRLWDELGRYLEAPGTSWVRFPIGWIYLTRGKVGELLAATIHAQEACLQKGALGYRVTIDGTIVKEWGVT